MKRYWRPVVALVVFAAGSGVAAGTPTSMASGTCSKIFKDNRWTYVTAPQWPATDTNFAGIPLMPPLDSVVPYSTKRGVTTVIVGPGNPQRILISDDRSLLRSSDGGCTWSTILSVFTEDSPAVRSDGLPVYPNDFLQLVAVPATSAAGAQRIIYAAVRSDPLAGGGNFAVLRSRDDGQTWAAIAPNPIVPGLGPARTAGQVSLLAVAPSDPATVYVGSWRWSPQTQAAQQTLYVSRDSGKTWSTSTLPAYGQELPDGLTVDPRDPASIWLTIKGGLYNSPDAGATWQKALSGLEPAQPVQMYWPRKGKAPWLLTSTSKRIDGVRSPSFHSQSTPQLSADGGRSWKALPPLEMHTDLLSRPGHPTFAFDQYGRIVGVTLLGSGSGQDGLVVMRLSGETWREQQGVAITPARGNWNLYIAQTAEHRPKLVMGVFYAAAPDFGLAEYALP